MTDETSHPAGYLSDSRLASYQAYTKPLPRGLSAVLLCGDDRAPTDASCQLLDAAMPADTVPLATGSLRIYGGVDGVAKCLLVAGASVHGQAFITRAGGFDGCVVRIRHAFQNRIARHSDEAKEGNADHLNDTADGPLGCAYANNLGLTSQLLAADRTGLNELQRLAIAESATVFGSSAASVQLFEGHRLVAAYLSSLSPDHTAAGFAVTRARYAADQLPTAILHGKHASAPATGVVQDFRLNVISDPVAAQHDGRQFYYESIGSVTDTLLPVLRDLQVPPEMLLRALSMDAVPTRSALVGTDADATVAGRADPYDLAIGILGDVRQTIRQLNTQYAAA